MNHTFIHDIQIATPCKANWDEMTGDERARFCHDCKLNVYNISAMTIEEAEELIITKEGKVCLRMYRRSDGTVLTKDCPKGIAAVKRRMLALYGSVSAVASFVLMWMFNTGKPESDTCAVLKTEPYKRDIPTVNPGWTAGTPAFPSGAIMGQMVAVPQERAKK